MQRFEDRHVQLGGIRTRFWRAGEQGSPVLLLHGIGCSVHEWDASLAALAQRHRVFALDLLGAGDTDKPAAEDYSLARLARFIVEFLDSQGLAQAHLAGNSLGGRLALECALAAPQRVASLLLAAPAGVGRETFINFRLATLPWLGELLTRPSRAGLRMLWRLAFHDPSRLEDERLDHKLHDAKRPGAQAAFLKTLRGFLEFGGFPREQLARLHAALPGVRQPTLIVWGRGDRLLPVAQGMQLRAMLPNAALQVFDDCGHLPQLEAAERFNASALAFWAGVDAGVPSTS